MEWIVGLLAVATIVIDVINASKGDPKQTGTETTTTTKTTHRIPQQVRMPNGAIVTMYSDGGVTQNTNTVGNIGISGGPDKTLSAISGGLNTLSLLAMMNSKSAGKTTDPNVPVTQSVNPPVTEDVAPVRQDPIAPTSKMISQPLAPVAGIQQSPDLPVFDNTGLLKSMQPDYDTSEDILGKILRRRVA